MKLKPINKLMSKKEVFVTYSWDSEEHKNKVLSFTNFLRDEGYHAEVDQMLAQSETALDFVKMMHEAMTNYNKVIIVLSKGYKEKAESFKGGVGNEYGLILKDIESNKNKYTLVSFKPINQDIIPLSFVGRYIIDLTKEENTNELFAKLQGQSIIDFVEVAKEKRPVNKREIPKFDTYSGRIEVENINVRIDNSSMSAMLYSYIEYDLNLIVKNVSKQLISDYSVEVYYPAASINHLIHGRIEGNHKVVLYEQNAKLFPYQSKSIKLEMLSLKYHTIDKIIGEKLKIVIFSELGNSVAEYPIIDILFINNDYGEQLRITSDNFKKE